MCKIRIVRPLGTTIDNNLKSDKDCSHKCIKANRKLTVLTRVRKRLDIDKTKILKINSGKYNLLISGHKAKQILAQIEEHNKWETRTVKVLGITIDNNLKLYRHVVIYA